MLERWRQPARPWRERRLWVLDLELTGLDPRDGYILSAGWVAISGGEIRLASAGHCLFRQGDGVGDDVRSSAHLHHITDQQREGGRDLATWLRQVITEHRDDLWVFHHAPLDTGFLRTACRRLALDWPRPGVLDTLRFEHKRMPRYQPAGYRDLTLPACRRRYGLPEHRPHHALSDALATAELLLAQVRSRLPDDATDRQLLKAF